jgi:hypothetical protein
VFFAGCSDEQMRFHWDLRVVLTVPETVLADRCEIEPLLLASADLVIDTRQPVPAVIAAILDLIGRAAVTAK